MQTSLQAAPNPFNPQTQIQLQLAQSGHVELAIFDVRGRQVRTLQRGTMSAGSHQFTWDARTDQGSRLGSGVYFLRGNVLGEIFQKRLILLK
jgi:flagellar hook assembly protein FlgD